MRAVIALAAIGCIGDPTIECGELRCPAGSVCTSLGCASAGQVEACANGTCTGGCIEGVCFAAICGDARIVGDEVCDDGNQRSGDGCSADCRSRETCGNDYVDPLAGEQCDLGVPGLSRDG